MEEDIKNNDNDLDEFWKDCIKPQHSFYFYNKKSLNSEKYIKIADEKDNTAKKKSIKNINKNGRKPPTKKEEKIKKELFINDIDFNNFKSKVVSTAHTSPFNKQILNDLLLKEELMPLKNQNKKENNIKKNNTQYNKKYNISTQKVKYCKKAKFINADLKECTFKPKKSKNKMLENKIIKLYKDSDIYKRNIKIQQKKKEKIAYVFSQFNKSSKNSISKKCIFHPELKAANLKNCLNKENKWKKRADNDSNKLFLLRYMKAREEEIDKMERLNSPINKKLRKTFSFQGKLPRVLSKKDSMILQNNLHKSLNSFQNLFQYDEDDDMDREIEEEKKEPIDLRYIQWTFSKIN